MGLLDQLLTGAMQNMGRGGSASPLDGLLGGLSGGSGNTGGGAGALLQIVAQMLSNHGGGSAGMGGGMGGLGGLLQQFQQAGLGREMNSWISTGQNLPVSMDQLAQVFGQDRMQQMAAQAGMPVEQFGGQLSELLPEMVDRLTPDGQAPQGGFDDALAALSKLMPR